MMWIPLKMINGWVAHPDDPPRFVVVPEGISVTGSAVPTKSPKLACARLPKEVRPEEEIDGEIEVDACTIVYWRIKPNGLLYIKKHHILEFL